MRTKIFTVLIFAMPFLASAQTLTIASGATVTIGPGAAMTSGDIVNTDVNGLVIQSDATAAGSLIYTATGTEPHATVELWVGNTDQWHFVSPPTTPNTANDFYISSTQGAWLARYDETAGLAGWNYVVDLDTTVEMGRGYTYWQDPARAESGKVTLTGQLKSSDAEWHDEQTGPWDLSYSGSGADDENFGWNLIGNPFSASIQEGVGTLALVAGLERALWIWVGGTTNNYLTWLFPAEGEPNPANPTDPLIIAMGQAFFVKADGTGTGTEADLTIFADKRANNATPPIYKKSTNSESEINFYFIEFLAQNNNSMDRVVIEFPKTEDGYGTGKKSISKFFGPETSVQLYAQEGARNVSFKMFQDILYDQVAPMSYAPGKTGAQKIIADLEWMPEDADVFLEDLKTGEMYDLVKNNTYSFTGDKGDDAERFLVHFSYSPNDIEEDEFTIGSSVDIYAHNKMVYITNKDAATFSNADIFIYDIYGRPVIVKQTQLGSLTRIPVQLSNSYLVVRVVKGNETYTEKVFIK